MITDEEKRNLLRNANFYSKRLREEISKGDKKNAISSIKLCVSEMRKNGLTPCIDSDGMYYYKEDE